MVRNFKKYQIISKFPKCKITWVQKYLPNSSSTLKTDIK